MPAKKEITNRLNTIKKQFPELLKKHMGNMSSICKAVNISRTTYYDWRLKDAKFAAACDEAIEYRLDYVESKLFKCIEKEELGAICFFLKTQGKKRGYVERVETTGLDGNAIKHEVDINATKEQIDALVRIGKGE